jgi:hypothetical protein
MKIKTVCCECGDIIQDGITIRGAVSHGYCERCYGVIMAFLEGRDYDHEHAKQIKTISI